MIAYLGCKRVLSEENLANSVEFVRIFVYGGKKEEDLVDTRVRMYKKQSKKKTSSLPPNPNSLRYYILRTHHLAFIWKRCLYAIVVPLPLNENGWKEDNGIVVPIWYKCSQLPPSMNKKKIRIHCRCRRCNYDRRIF